MGVNGVLATHLKPLLSLILSLSFALLLPGDAAAVPPGTGQFIVGCRYTHSRAADPIVSFGVFPSRHLHDFFGNESTNETSTHASLREAGTTCRVDHDRSAYWVPAAYDRHGHRVPMAFVQAYYRAEPGIDVHAFPAGARILAGNAYASSDQRGLLRFHCGQNGPHTSPRRSAPYDCSAYVDPTDSRFIPAATGVVIEILFPACWRGSGTNPTDFRYGTPRPSNQATCPSGFAVRVPNLSPRFHTNLVDGVGMRFSSGPYFTGHADFFEAWNRKEFRKLVERCLNAHALCGHIV
jgi:hypothetical protein